MRLQFLAMHLGTFLKDKIKVSMDPFTRIKDIFAYINDFEPETAHGMHLQNHADWMLGRQQMADACMHGIK